MNYLMLGLKPNCAILSLIFTLLASFLPFILHGLIVKILFILKLYSFQPIFFRGEHRLNVEEKKNREMRPPRLPRGDTRPGSGGPPRGGSMGRGGGRGSTGGVGGKGGSGSGRSYNPQR